MFVSVELSRQLPVTKGRRSLPDFGDNWGRAENRTTGSREVCARSGTNRRWYVLVAGETEKQKRAER